MHENLTASSLFIHAKQESPLEVSTCDEKQSPIKEHDHHTIDQQYTQATSRASSFAQ